MSRNFFGGGSSASKNPLVPSSRKSPVPNPFSPQKGEYVKKLKTLGEGTYGIVYAYELGANRKKYAVKRSKSSGDQISSDLREASILKAVNHPYVVRVVDIGFSGSGGIFSKGRLSDQNVYVVLQYADQGNLADLLYSGKRSPLSGKILKKAAYEILVGVDYLHSQSILHRDLKPENILVSADGTMKIADFGLSRALSCADGTNMSLEVVSLSYRAPKVLAGSGHYGPEIDKWSVGCILAEMWTREILFKGRDERDQLKKINERIGTPSSPGQGNFDEIESHYIKQIVTGFLVHTPDGVDGGMTLRQAYSMPFFNSVRVRENEPANLRGKSPEKGVDLPSACRSSLLERTLPIAKIPSRIATVQEVKRVVEWLLGAAYYLTDDLTSPTKLYSFAVDLFYRTLASCMPLPETRQTRSKIGKMTLHAAACLWVASNYVETYPFSAGEFLNPDLGGFFDTDIRDAGYRIVKHLNFDILTTSWEDLFMEKAGSLHLENTSRPKSAKRPEKRRFEQRQIQGFAFPEAKLAMAILSLSPEYASFSTETIADLGIFVASRGVGPKPLAYQAFEVELRRLTVAEKSGSPVGSERTPIGHFISNDLRLGSKKRFLHLASTFGFQT